MDSSEVESLFLVNQDAVKTSYKVPTLAEVLALLKDKVYINVDKFWIDVEGISAEIRKAGVEKQVIVKTGTDEKTLEFLASRNREDKFKEIKGNKFSQEEMNNSYKILKDLNFIA